MGRCKDCKHWDRDNTNKLPHDSEGLACLLVGNVDRDRGGYKSLKFTKFAVDYPVCSFVTAPDFGCNQFEQAERTLAPSQNAQNQP